MSRRLTSVASERGRARSAVGTSLLELVVAMFIALLVLGAVYRLYTQGRRNYERPKASVQIQESMMGVARMLQRELSETSLQSVRSYPSVSSPGEAPGLSFESPRAVDGDALVMGEFGVVRWQKYVYYTLVPDPDRPGTGRLMRKEGPLDDQGGAIDPARRIPRASALRPSEAPGLPERNRVVGRHVMLANQKVDDVVTLGAGGGFSIWWKDGATERRFEDGQAGEPIMVDLALRDVSSATGQDTVMRLQIRVTPKN